MSSGLVAIEEDGGPVDDFGPSSSSGSLSGVDEEPTKIARERCQSRSDVELRTLHRSTIYAPASIVDASKIHSGYLNKEGESADATKKRFVVSDGPVIYLYHDKKRTQCGTFVALGAIVGRGGEGRTPHSFFLSLADSNTTVWLSAESDEERDAWVAHLVEHAHCQLGDDAAAAAKRNSNVPTRSVLIEGLLEKRKEGKMAGWRSRYVVVYHDVIQYYESQAIRDKGGPPKGEIALMDGFEVTVEKSLIIRVVPSGDILLLRAPSASVREEWLSILSTLSSAVEGKDMPLKQGWLQKQPISSSGKSWKSRYFVCTPVSLAYYSSRAQWQKGGQAKGKLDFTDGMSVAPLYVTGEFRFSITTPTSSVVLKADSVEARTAWVGVLDTIQNSTKAVSKVYKLPLVDIMARYDAETAPKTPVFFHRLCEYVHTNGLKIEGVFRKSAEKPLLMKVAKSFDKDENCDFASSFVSLDEGVHVAAGAIKLWLRQLPEPLLTYAFYDTFISIARMEEDSAEQAEAMRDLVYALPYHHYHVLHELMHLMHAVQAHCDVNLMTASNLAVVLSPNILGKNPGAGGPDPMQVLDLPYQTKCVTRLINLCDFIFVPL